MEPNIDADQAPFPTWNKDSIDQILQDIKPGYITKVAVDLESSPDLEPWNPSELIRELVPNFDDIQVRMLEEGINLNAVAKDFTKSKTVGLIILGHVVSRQSAPSLICLTSEDTIYALDPTFETGITFLRLQLKNNRLMFVIPVGLEESDCLYHNYGIDLTDARSRADSCSAKHARLMEVMRNLPDSCLKGLYPPEAIRASKRKLMVERFETVASIWLGIDKSELYYNATQLNHLRTRPLSLTATNVIKKRCILVRCLYDILSSYVWREFEEMNALTVHRLNDLDGHMKGLATELIEDEENPSSASCFYLHLDGYIWDRF